MTSKYIKFRRKDVEAGAFYSAAECLLVGIEHIKKHRFSYSFDFDTFEEWEKVLDEISWYLVLVTKEGVDKKTASRAKSAEKLLGKYFTGIWC